MTGRADASPTPRGALDTPVVALVFNRPDATARLLAAIRTARPTNLLVVGDGPRASVPQDPDLVQQTRAVFDRIDWPCDVQTHLAERNLGCRDCVSGGLDWAFGLVEEAIILEDDCIPDASFFWYCREVLQRYRTDPRVMHVNGNNYGTDHRRLHRYAYSFCHLPQVWGWATWRRAWRHFDVRMRTWPAFRDGGFLRSLPLGRVATGRQKRRWEAVYRGEVDTWDFQWHYAVMSQRGLSVAPAVNLVSNIGFGAAATHTLDPTSAKARLPTSPLGFPLAHPPFVVPNPAIDRIYERNMLDDSPLVRARGKARRLVRSALGM